MKIKKLGGGIDSVEKIGISKEEFKKSNIYLFLINNKRMILGHNLFFAKINLFWCKTPNKLRIRNDKFLKNVKENKYSILISSFIDENDCTFFLIFKSLSFFGYKSSTSSSNSFINFSKNELINFVKYPGIQYVSGRGRKRKYIFYCIKENKFNKQDLEIFLEFNSNLEISFNNEILSKMDPPIPKKNKDDINILYNHSCCIYFLDSIYCKTKIDWVKTREAIQGTNLNLPLDFHHFIPRKYFKDNFENEILKWDIIHQKINLLPLCQICHNSIHSGDEKITRETFTNIIQTLKNNNNLDKFQEFLKINTTLENLDKLLEFYLKNKVRTN